MAISYLVGPAALIFTIISVFSGIKMVTEEKPYGSMVPGLHKISSVLMILLFGVLIWPEWGGNESKNLVDVFFYLTIGLFLLSSVSGAILANLKSEFIWLNWSHRIISILTYCSGIWAWSLTF